MSPGTRLVRSLLKGDSHLTTTSLQAVVEIRSPLSLLFPRLNNPSSLSFSSQEFCSKPFSGLLPFSGCAPGAQCLSCSNKLAWSSCLDSPATLNKKEDEKRNAVMSVTLTFRRAVASLLGKTWMHMNNLYAMTQSFLILKEKISGHMGGWNFFRSLD